MRLVAKIFLSVIAVFSVAFFLAGYFLLFHSLETSVQRELKFALRQYQFDKFSVQSNLLANEEHFNSLMENDTHGPEAYLKELSRNMEEPICLLTEDGTVLYSGSSAFDSLPFDDLSEGETSYQVVYENGSCYILVGGRMELSEWNLDFVTQTDITSIIEQQDVLKRYFLNCLLLAMAAAMVLVLVISVLLTRPLGKMAAAADRIAGGNYHERLDIRQKGEVGDLAGSFNRMAAAVEDKVKELKDEVQRKEDFVANFAHELKTPMTTIAGYTDGILDGTIPPERERQYLQIISDESRRLSRLVRRMLDISQIQSKEMKKSSTSAKACAWRFCPWSRRSTSAGLTSTPTSRRTPSWCSATMTLSRR